MADLLEASASLASLTLGSIDAHPRHSDGALLAACFVALGGAVGRNRSLARLSVRTEHHATLAADAVAALCDGLRRNGSLAALELRNCDVDDQQAEALAAAVGANTAIQTWRRIRLPPPRVSPTHDTTRTTPFGPIHRSTRVAG